MMRRILGLSVVAAMLCVASSALAAPGLSLRWDHCSGEGNGANNKAFARASNVGSNLMVVSFELPAVYWQDNWARAGSGAAPPG